MYNIDFLFQLENSRRHIFGNLDPRDLPLSVGYYPPPGTRIIECIEAPNGEYVPTTTLEEKV